MTSLLVCYTLSTFPDNRPLNAVVDLPADIDPRDIPDYVKRTVRPAVQPDPSDGFRGRNPSEVTLLNLVNLNRLQYGEANSEASQ